MIRAPNALAMPQTAYGTPVDYTPGNLSPDFRAVQPGIFAGESGGDYDALFGFSNRTGGPFDDVRLTDMTVAEAAAFADPSGPYAQWVKSQVGHVATPMGAYQVVGTTLKAAMDGLGLTGNEPMTPEVQDQIGQWIFENQGVGAWEGYRPGVTDMPQGGGGSYRGPMGGTGGGQTGGGTYGTTSATGSGNALAMPDMAAAQALQQQQRQAQFNALLEGMNRPIYTNVMQGSVR